MLHFLSYTALAIIFLLAAAFVLAMFHLALEHFMWPSYVRWRGKRRNSAKALWKSF